MPGGGIYSARAEPSGLILLLPRCGFALARAYTSLGVRPSAVQASRLSSVSRFRRSAAPLFRRPLLGQAPVLPRSGGGTAESGNLIRLAGRAGRGGGALTASGTQRPPGVVA